MGEAVVGRPRPTPRGVVVLGVVGAGPVGLVLHYPALVAVGAWALGAVLLAAAAVARPVRLTTAFEGVRTREPRGARRTVSVRAGNPGSRRTPACLLARPDAEDLSVPALDPGRSHPAGTTVSFPRRGEYRLGPVDVVRTDPLGLVRRAYGPGAVAVVLVRPVPVELARRPVTASRSAGAREGRLFEGSVEFDGLQEYVPGDDLRRIHWPSSQRTRRLLVRTFVDVALPLCTVVLDGDPAAYAGEDEVELAVDAAASVGCAAVGRQLVRLWAGGPPDPPGREAASPRDRLLDRLARWTPDPQPGGLPRVAAQVRAAGAGGSLVLVTGSREAGQESVARGLSVAFRDVVLVRVGRTDAPVRSGSARTVLVGDRADLAPAWARTVGARS